MKAALYIRVSTDEQAEEGFSIPAQLTQLTEYCRKNNVEIYKPYIDEGVSAKSADEKKRPQFELMLKDAEKKLFNIIVVHKYDRFARNVELSQKVKRQLKKAGVNVISISEPIEDSPIGFFQEGILELLAEYYIRNLAQESKKGHVERARQGLHNGSIPYGYKRNGDNEMIIDPEHAKIVKMMFDMYLNQGYGSTKIATILNERGIPGAVGGKWAHYTVSRILKNVKYIGKIYYDGEIYEGKHEAIISEEDFNAVQTGINNNTWVRGYRGENFTKYCLLGLTRCGYCGKVMRIVNHKSELKQPNYYVCNSYMHSDSAKRCKQKNHNNAKRLEEKILKTIKETAYTSSTIENIEIVTDYTELYDVQKAKAEKALERAKAAYTSGDFSIEDLRAEKARYEKTMESLKSIVPEDDAKEKSDRLKNTIRSLWDKIENAESATEKRTLLQKFIKGIDVYYDHAVIHYYLQ